MPGQLDEVHKENKSTSLADRVAALAMILSVAFSQPKQLRLVDLDRASRYVRNMRLEAFDRHPTLARGTNNFDGTGFRNSPKRIVRDVAQHLAGCFNIDE